MMTKIINNNKKDSDWKGWALGVAILVIAGFASVFSGFSFTLIREMRAEFFVSIKEMRAEFLQEFKDMRVLNTEQDKYIAILSTHQEERLKKERLEGKKNK